MTIFELPPVYRDIRAEAGAVAAAVAGFALEADESSELHPPTLAALRGSGLCGLMVPAAHGGRFERVDPLAVCVVREVFMKASAHLDALFALQGIGAYAISAAGSAEQCRRWLPKVATGEALAALALTEPEAGSDLKSITTALRPESGAGGSLVLEGAKSFISNAPVAAFFTTLVREPAPGGGDDLYSLVLVPAGAEGVSVRPSPEITAPHVLGEVTFEAVRLGPEHRLGAPGRGFAHVLATLAIFRASVAGAAVGLMEGALEVAAAHAAARRQFGRPLVRLGPVAALLADSWADLESSRLLAYRAADAAREDPAGSLDYSSLAKLAATEAACRVVDRCVQVMGRWGLVRGSRIEQYYRQARPMRIYEGASEVLRLGIANRLCRDIVAAEATDGTAD
ncbi:MAG: acyl-CoA dehydrogenase family protein [bacterium]|nr:acyl-CoA dehydrogenase family protein [bacterium]MDE0668787.1 acyl-CoA dehydrogenase family protein [bacterium]